MVQSGNTASMIHLDGVSKRFSANGPPAVDTVDLSVGEGEIMMLIGPSGCGKTTTLRMINRLIEPSEGRIFIGGEDVTDVDPVQLRRRIGYVIQQVGLFPHLSVEANIATVPRLLGWDRGRISRRVAELLDLVRLDGGAAKRFPGELSGGQRQRVGVARALAADPPVLLMDEPFGAIDPITRSELQEEFLRMQADLSKTIVFVTHDLDEAVRLGDRIALFGPGGRLVQVDPPGHLLDAPASDFASSFVGQDRGLRRLGVTTIEPAHLLEESVPDSPVGTVPSHSATPRLQLGRSTLRDALAALLLSGTGRVDVTDDSGMPRGYLNAEAIVRASRDRADAEPVGAEAQQAD